MMLSDIFVMTSRCLLSEQGVLDGEHQCSTTPSGFSATKKDVSGQATSFFYQFRYGALVSKTVAPPFIVTL